MNKTIQVIEVKTIKSGSTNGKDWTIFKVICGNDNEMKEFTTFNNYQERVGQQMTGSFQYDSKWKNWKEVSEKQAEEIGKHEEIMKGIRENQRLLNTINAKVSGVGDVLNMPEKEEVPLPPEPQEEPTDNIPF